MSDFADNLRKSMINKTRRFMRMVQELKEKDDAALREQVIRMAREAGCHEASHPMNPWSVTQEALERFAALVAKRAVSNIDPASSMSYQEGYAAGVAAEREACAQLCDRMEKEADGVECCKWPTPADCAAAIRARGEK